MPFLARESTPLRLPLCHFTLCHRGLRVPSPKYKIRLVNETRQWQQGKALLLDDSFEHEIFTPDAPRKIKVDAMRVILIVDLWHPDLTRAEQTRTYSPTDLVRW